MSYFHGMWISSTKLEALCPGQLAFSGICVDFCGTSQAPRNLSKHYICSLQQEVLLSALSQMFSAHFLRRETVPNKDPLCSIKN